MDLELVDTKDAGSLTKERLVFRARRETDIGELLLIAARVEGIDPVAGSIIGYWFPNMLVDKGDVIVLHTKRGDDRSGRGRLGNDIHFFYWGKTEAVWSRPLIPVLIEASTWEY